MKASKVHFVGVGGVGMGSLAVALSSAGYEVSGSDGALYEPMRSVLANASIRLIEGYQPATLEHVKPDIVVLGNVLRKDNPEAVAWIQSGTRFISFPEAVRVFLIEDRESIVCAGTHGKTSTTNWIAYLLTQLGLAPSYFIGGVPRDLPQGCKLESKSKYFVGEGDEYDSSFFDKGPKFLHYNPTHVVLSNVEFDHADIYRDLDHVKSAFEKLISLIPGDGICLVRADDPVATEVSRRCLGRVQTFGVNSSALWRLGNVTESKAGFEFEIIYKNRSAGVFRTPMFGQHNLMNLISGIACAANLGQPMEKIRPVVETFHGAKRRQEILLTTPFTLVDDFAHHPTEVKATLTAVRQRFPEGKLIALFEPRSATARRSVHQTEYSAAFGPADHVLIATPYRAQELSPEARLSTEEITKNIAAAGKTAQSFDTYDFLLSHVLSIVQPGDVVVVMSNGEFGKIQRRIVEAF